MSSAQSGEGDIRRALVEADVVDCMIALPGQLFYSTQIPACLWFLARNKNPGGGWRDRRGEVLFIDARKLGHLVDRTRKEFSNEPRADTLGKRGLRLSSRLSSFRKRKSVPSPISWLGAGLQRVLASPRLCGVPRPRAAAEEMLRRLARRGRKMVVVGEARAAGKEGGDRQRVRAALFGVHGGKPAPAR